VRRDPPSMKWSDLSNHFFVGSTNSAMSLMGHSRPSQLAPKSSNVRYAPKATKMLQRRE